MEQTNKNRILFAIIILLCAVCYFAMRQHWISIPGMSYLLLGGALFLLYYTKQKSWAIWGCVLFAGLWCSQFLKGYFPNSHSIGGIFLFLLPGILILMRYKKTGWKGYVLPGCFLIWGGLYVLLFHFHWFASRPCLSLMICILMAFYSAGHIKRQTAGIPTVFVRAALSFIVCSMGFLPFLIFIILWYNKKI